jgi:hypothetical protein
MLEASVSMIDFQLQALPEATFASYFKASPEQLRLEKAWMVMADANLGYPCRVSLRDAEIGEKLLAISHTHLATTSPYHACGPIFVREQAVQAVPATNEIPMMFRHRKLSVRAYDQQAMMIDAMVCDGNSLQQTIRALFSNESSSYLHIHNAAPGCFNCSVLRV